jgi:hypothetical protein
MFIEMLFKTLPHSKRAAVALVVMLVTLGRGLATLQALLVPGSQESVPSTVIGLAALVISLVAAGFFYYFQSVDGQTKKPHEVEMLDHYYKSEQHKRATATPVFSSHEGEVKPVIKDRPGPPTAH